jgi:hypothetical protein
MDRAVIAVLARRALMTDSALIAPRRYGDRQVRVVRRPAELGGVDLVVSAQVVAPG